MFQTAARVPPQVVERTKQFWQSARGALSLTASPASNQRGAVAWPAAARQTRQTPQRPQRPQTPQDTTGHHKHHRHSGHDRHNTRHKRGWLAALLSWGRLATPIAHCCFPCCVHLPSILAPWYQPDAAGKPRNPNSPSRSQVRCLPQPFPRVMGTAPPQIDTSDANLFISFHGIREERFAKYDAFQILPNGTHMQHGKGTTVACISMAARSTRELAGNDVCFRFFPYPCP